MQYFKRDINLFIAIILFIILSVSYVLVIPVFEAPDENYHLLNSFYISKYNKIYFTYNEPIPRSQYVKDRIDEDQNPVFYTDEKYAFVKKDYCEVYKALSPGYHPPLYYLISSQIIRPFGADNIYAEFNSGDSGTADDDDYYNRFINNKILKDRSPTIALVLILRLLQIVFGVLVIIFIFKIIRLLSNNKFEKKSIFLISSIAFLPQFIFLCSYVNNDLLSGLFGLISIYFIILLFKKEKIYLGMISILFAIIATFTKYTLLVMIPLIVIAFFVWLIIKKKKKIIIGSITVLLLTISAFYYIKIFQSSFYLYNRIINAGNRFIANFKDIFYFDMERFTQTLKSSIAVFGWMNIFADNFIYYFFAAYIASGILLFFTNIREYRKSRKSIIFIIVSIISIFTFFLLYAINTGWAQHQGRIMLTGIFLVFILSILGYQTIKIKYRNILYYILFSCSFFISVFCLYNYIYLKYY